MEFDIIISLSVSLSLCSKSLLLGLFLSSCRDDWIRGYRDGRNIHRIVLWNAYVQTELIKLGLPPAVPLMHITMPMIGMFDDNAHFPQFVYGQAFRITLALMCISTQ